MMVLTQENVHYTLNSGPGLMNRQVEQGYARIQEFLSGGGGGGGGGGGVSKETHITFDFPGRGSGPANPPLDPHVGSPDATVCLQNHGLSKFK